MKLTNPLFALGIILAICIYQGAGFTIPSTENDNQDVDVESPANLQDGEVNSYYGGGRIKRQVLDYDSDVVYSPYYGYGYYVFPRAFPEDDNENRRAYKPVVRYRSTHTRKRKKLFVPNLFG